MVLNSCANNEVFNINIVIFYPAKHKEKYFFIIKNGSSPYVSVYTLEMATKGYIFFSLYYMYFFVSNLFRSYTLGVEIGPKTNTF